MKIVCFFGNEYVFAPFLLDLGAVLLDGFEFILERIELELVRGLGFEDLIVNSFELGRGARGGGGAAATPNGSSSVSDQSDSAAAGGRSGWTFRI